MRDRKIYPIVLIIVMCMLVFNSIVALCEYFDYQKRVNSGNARWVQVEERIKAIEECCGCDGRVSEDSF